MKISTVFFVISSMPYLLQLTLSCDPNQILIEGKCVTIKYMPGCREYYPDGNCKYCQIGKDLVIGRFCVAHPYEDVCCPKVDQEGNCLECVNQLSLVDKVCMLTTIVGCIKKDENNPERCETCGVGYVTRSGKCDINSVGCAVQDAVKGCLFCKPDFHFKDDKCVPNSVQKTCKNFNENGCYQCQYGYYMTKYRKCVGFDLSCQFYQKGVCVLCKKPYKLNNGVCELHHCTTSGPPGTGCQTCTAPYISVYGVCKLPNCLQAIQNDKCALCANNARIQKDLTCVKDPQLICATPSKVATTALSSSSSHSQIVPSQ